MSPWACWTAPAACRIDTPGLSRTSPHVGPLLFGPLGALRYHRHIEAARLAYRDRDAFVADPSQADVPANTTLREGLRCLRTMMGEWDQYHVGQATANRTIFVANAGLTATQFDLTTDQRSSLFRNGAEAATRSTSG